MQLPHADQLEIQYLSRLFDNKSECYKLFWFHAIVVKAALGQQVLTYEELIDEMIADAWYMVSEYHLNLGPKDNLEAIVLRIFEISGLKSSEKKEKIIEYIRACQDKEVRRIKVELKKNVPYRLQAPFAEDIKGREWAVSEKTLALKMNQQKRLIYYYEEFNGLNTQIVIQPEWMDYIIKNQEILKGWIQFNMITYLQKRNPSVSGISYKLFPPKVRNLNKVKKFWRVVISLDTVHEIYAGKVLTDKDLSIDHFVPWSYVAHDEFWNLNPTTRCINSSKSNKLPDWDKYFPHLCEMEFLSYEMIWKHEAVLHEFEECAKEHLNNDEIRRRLYRKNQSKQEFRGNLFEVVNPVYNSAKNMGFQDWEISNE